MLRLTWLTVKKPTGLMAGNSISSKLPTLPARKNVTSTVDADSSGFAGDGSNAWDWPSGAESSAGWGNDEVGWTAGGRNMSLQDLESRILACISLQAEKKSCCQTV